MHFDTTFPGVVNQCSIFHKITMSYLTVYHNQCTKTVIISPVIGVVQTNEMDLKECVLLSIPTYFRQYLAQ